MFRIVLLGLLVASVLAPTSAFGQESLVHSFTTEDGKITFDYPADWVEPVVNEQQGNYYVALHNGVGLDTESVEPGERYVIIETNVSVAPQGYDAAPLDNYYAELQAQIPEKIALIEVNGRRAIRIYETSQSTNEEVIAYIFEPNPTTNIYGYNVRGFAPIGEAQDFEPILEAIATSIRFNDPAVDVLPTTEVQPSSSDTMLTRVLLQPAIPTRSYTTDDLRMVANTISRRLNALGVANGTVQIAQNSVLIVELPTVPNVDEIIQTLQETGLFEFVDFSGLNTEVSSYIGQKIATTQQVLIQQQHGLTQSNSNTSGDIVLMHPVTNQPFTTIISGADIQSAEAEFDVIRSNGEAEWHIRFELTPDGVNTFSPFTASHVGLPIAAVVNGVVLSSLTIQQQFNPTDRGYIIATHEENGVFVPGFSEQAAKRLAIQIRSGALNIPLEVVQVDSPQADTPQVRVIEDGILILACSLPATALRDFRLLDDILGGPQLQHFFPLYEALEHITMVLGIVEAATTSLPDEVVMYLYDTDEYQSLYYFELIAKTDNQITAMEIGLIDEISVNLLLGEEMCNHVA